MSDGVFRKKNGFTAVKNSVAKDMNLSCAALGMYTRIMAYITIPDSTWTRRQFENMFPEGQRAFNTCWKELKEKGYLKVHVFPNGGKKDGFKCEIELLDEAKLGPHTFYYSGSGKVTGNNETRTLQNVGYANVGCANVDGANQGCANDKTAYRSDAKIGNNNKNNNKKLNNNISINQSILEDRWNEIVEYKKSEGALPFGSIIQNEEFKAAFIHGIMKSCGSYMDETRQSALEVIPVVLDEMLNAEVPTIVCGRKYSASKILSIIDNRIRSDDGNLDLNETIDSAIGNYMNAIKNGPEDVKNNIGYLKSCFWNSLVGGSLDIRSAITRYQAMVN